MLDETRAALAPLAERLVRAVDCPVAMSAQRGLRSKLFIDDVTNEPQGAPLEDN